MPPRITRNHEYAKILARTVKDNKGFTSLANTANFIDSADVIQIASGISANSLTVYDTLDSLPTSSLTKGGQGYVKATQRLYISDSFGWYSAALVNLTPTQTLDPAGNITLSIDGTSTIVTITATDSDQPESQLSYSIESDGNMLATGATVTQDSSVFTITPLSADSGGVAGDFTLTFKTTDNVNIATTTKDFSLTFTPSTDWSTAPTEQAILTASDAQDSDQFGWDIDIDDEGEYIIVGAPQEDTTASNAGSAYIFTRSGSTWTQQQKIQGSTVGSGDQFGYGVAINADATYAAVGAIYDDDQATNSGAAYVFTRSGSTWTQQAKLMDIYTSTNKSSDKFGAPLAFSKDGSRLVIGAWYYNDSGESTSTGAVYVMRRSGSSWTREATLRPTGSGGNASRFGWDVDISEDGDRLIVGARYDSSSGRTQSGAVYFFHRTNTTWTLQQKRAPTDISNTDSFGVSVAISRDGTYAIIGSIGEDQTAAQSGAAYVYYWSGTGWNEERKLKASDASLNASFGADVSINEDGTFVVIGTFDDDQGTNAGGLYVFRRTGGSDDDAVWTQQQRVNSSDIATNDRFGSKVSMNKYGNYVLGGAPRADGSGNDDEGAVYVYNAE
jgi:hypothetical protein